MVRTLPMVSEASPPGGGESQGVGQTEDSKLLPAWESSTSYDVPFLRTWRSNTSLEVPILGPRASLVSRSSLLSRASHLSASEAGLEDQGFFATGWGVRLAEECWRLAYLGGPLMLQQLVDFSTGLVSQTFVGRLGEFELSVIVLATSVFNATGLIALMGVAGPMETLCGQAYGAQRYGALGVIFQRALLICLSAAAIILVVWSQLERLLLAIGQDAAIAAATSRYIFATIPSLLLLVFTECARRYLMAQSVVTPMAVICAFGALSAPFYFWLFIYRCGLGLMGAAVALAAVQLSNALLMGAYIVWHNRRLAGTKESPWTGWSAGAFKNWGQYIKIGIPSLFMLCLEWWLFESLIFFAGLLPHPELNLAAMGVLMSVLATVYQFSYGLGSAVSVRVSNTLGAGDGQGAVTAAVAADLFVVVGQGLFGLAMYFGRHFWGRVFTNEESVIELTASAMWVIALLTIGDGVNAINGGVVRGCGRQAWAAVANGVTFWGLGMPLSVVLAFKMGWGIAGLWLGCLVAASVQAVIVTGFLLRLDWREEARRAAEVEHWEPHAVVSAEQGTEREGLLTPLAPLPEA